MYPSFYQQIQALRDVTQNNFPNGQIRYQFSIEGGQSWHPKKTYFRIRTGLDTVARRVRDQAAGAVSLGPARVDDDLGPSMFFGDSLFQQLELYINGTCVNKQDNYCHQIAALRRRLNSEQNNKTYQDQNFSDPYLYSRINKTLSGGGSDKLVPTLVPLVGTFFTTGDGVANTNHTYTIASANGISTITFILGGAAAGVLPDIRGFFKPGQCVYFLDGTTGVNNAANVWRSREILTVTSISITVNQTDSDGTIVDRAGQNLLPDPISFYVSIAQPAKCGRSLNKWETIWQPALGFFQKDQWMPAGDYEIILTPHPSNSYQRYAIESYTDKQPYNSAVADANQVGAFKFQVLSMELNLCKCNKPSVPSLLQLEEIRCQAGTINTSSQTQKQFIIQPNTHTLALAYQDNRAVNQTNYSTSKFKLNRNRELYLTRLFIQYDGTTLPNPYADPEFVFNSEDYFTQRYMESQFYKDTNYESIETLQEWKERGPYYLFKWPRKINSKASEVQITQQFTSTAFNGDTELKPQLLLFDFYNCSFQISYDMNMGRISKIEKLTIQ